QVHRAPFGGDRDDGLAALVGGRGGGRLGGLRCGWKGDQQPGRRQGQAGNRCAQRRGTEAFLHLVLPPRIGGLARSRRDSPRQIECIAFSTQNRSAIQANNG